MATTMQITDRDTGETRLQEVLVSADGRQRPETTAEGLASLETRI